MADVETGAAGGQPSLKRGVSMTGKLANFGCALERAAACRRRKPPPALPGDRAMAVERADAAMLVDRAAGVAPLLPPPPPPPALRAPTWCPPLPWRSDSDAEVERILKNQKNYYYVLKVRRRSAQFGRGGRAGRRRAGRGAAGWAPASNCAP